MHSSLLSTAVRSLVFGGLSCLTLFFVGCEKAVTIQLPASGASTAPVTTLQVKFHSDFKPGTFLATLDGQNITGRFNPIPAAGSVSTASPDFMEKTADWNHTLHVEGDFATPSNGLSNRQRYDDVTFQPPTIWVYRELTTDGDLTLREADVITATATVVTAPKEALVVTISTDENPAVSLNNQPAGTPITVTIPTNDRRAQFTVRGITPGQHFFVRALAHGFASAPGGGTVNSRGP